MDVSTIPFEEIASTYARLIKEDRHNEANEMMDAVKKEKDELQDLINQLEQEAKKHDED
jgi:hypothetical protein